MNQVFVCGTYFHVYVSILKALHDHHDSQRLLVLNTLTPGIERLMPRLVEEELFDVAVQIPFREISVRMKKEQVFWTRPFNRKKKIIQYVDSESEMPKYHDFISQSEINLFHHLGMSSSYFISKYSDRLIRMLEDGTRNYITTVSGFKYFKRKYLLQTFIGEGNDNEVKEIHVQHPENLHSRISHKGLKLDLKTMQRSLSPQDNERILKVFMGSYKPVFNSSKKVILLTQPLSEDQFITEQDKLNLYASILKKYSSDYELFIKPHPREKTDYAKSLGLPISEIPRAFPLEMFDLMNTINFDVGITVSSGSIKNVACILNKVILGVSHVPNVLPGKKIV